MKEINPNYYTISDYAQRLARQLCDQFYQQHAHVKGDQILSFCAEPQINLMVIKNIFVKWREESEKSKSPFFDYQNAEVLKAHQNLMNTLSRNILVPRKVFEPVLTDSIEDTLLWILSPFEFLKKQTSHLSQVDIEEQLVSVAKYMRVRKPFFEQLIKTFQQEGKKTIPTLELLAAARLAWEKEPEQNYEILLMPLQKMLPAQVADFMLAEIPQFIEKEPISTFQLDEIKFDSFEEEKLSLTPSPDTMPFEAENEGSFKPFRLSYEEEEERPSVRSRISLEQKFRFINELFKGDSQSFEQAVDIVEKCADYNKAIMLIKEKYFRPYQWDLEKNEVKEFYEIISSRFLN